MRSLLVVLLLFVPLSAQAWPWPGCRYGPGALPSDTLARFQPRGDEIPIDHILVLMQENRSFDHYFGRLQLEGQPRARREPSWASNPNPVGGLPIRPFHQTRVCEVADLSHSWNGTHREWNGGRMDGFTAANANPADPSGSRAMGYYRKTDLPFYFALYSTFAMGDGYFSSVLTSTWPNRFFLLAGTSFGHIRNDFPTGTGFTQPTVFRLLEDAGVSWKIYYSDLPFGFVFADVMTHMENVVPIDEYYADAAAGSLPQVAFVDPAFFGGPEVESDEHPPANVQVGQAFVAQVVNALIDSPNWPSAALFVAYDEHGGFYDHVPPPRACVPDDIPPQLGPGDVVADFDRLGIRVPMVVVSPWVRPRFVSHRVYDHTSILRFIETRFELPALSRRDANANPMLDLFDFRRPALLVPPRLPDAPIDPIRALACTAEGSGEL